MSKRRILTTLFLLLAIVLGTIVVANAQKRTKRRKSSRQAVEWVPVDSWEPEKGSQFSKYTRELPSITKVELRLLKSSGGQVNVVASKVLLNGEAEQFAKIWRRLKRGNGHLCFAPAYNLRFYANDQFLFVTDVCFGCDNLILQNDKHQQWGFDGRGQSGQTLLKALKALLPE